MHQAIIQMQTTQAKTQITTQTKMQTTTQTKMQTTMQAEMQTTIQTITHTTTQTTTLARTHLVKMPAVQTTDTRKYKKDCTERAIFFIDSLF